jgi:hypothetical protein
MDTASSVSPITQLFMGVLILALGFALVKMVLKTRTSKDWANTVGTIIESRIEVQKDSEGQTDHPIVAYEYTVNGQLFRSQQIDFGGEGSGGTGAKSLVKKYPSGKSVTVYYNPNNPSEAVLERSAVGAMLMFGLGLVILIAVLVYTMTSRVSG